MNQLPPPSYESIYNNQSTQLNKPILSSQTKSDQQPKYNNGIISIYGTNQWSIPSNQVQQYVYPMTYPNTYNQPYKYKTKNEPTFGCCILL